MTKIGCLGEVMLELVVGPNSDATLGIAGDTYNTAVYLKREQPDWEIDYITGLGLDGFSDRIRKHMCRFQLGTGRVFSHPDRGAGLYAIETDDAGERRFTYWRSASAARCLGDPGLPSIPELLDGLTHLYYSGISLAILAQDNRNRLFEAIDAFRSAGGVVAFDSNYRPHLWNNASLARHEISRAWRRCDIALPSIDDELSLFGDANEEELLNRLKGYGVEQGTLKRGKRGPASLHGNGISPVARPDAVIDTTAAGDSFNAAYLGAFLNGRGQDAAMHAGHALACKVVARKGAIIFARPD